MTVGSGSLRDRYKVKEEAPTSGPDVVIVVHVDLPTPSTLGSRLWQGHLEKLVKEIRLDYVSVLRFSRAWSCVVRAGFEGRGSEMRVLIQGR